MQEGLFPALFAHWHYQTLSLTLHDLTALDVSNAKGSDLHDASLFERMFHSFLFILFIPIYLLLLISLSILPMYSDPFVSIFFLKAKQPHTHIHTQREDLTGHSLSVCLSL